VVLKEMCRETFIDSLDKRIMENTIGSLAPFNDTTIAPAFYATKMRGLKFVPSLKTKPEDSQFVRNFKRREIKL